MFMALMGAGEEPESTIKVKLWPVISLMIAGLVGLAIYVAGHESRICVAEKAAITTDRRVAEIDTKIEKMSADMNLYFSIREPRWEEWKKWDAKKRKNGDGQ
jgi:hypothetical protein